MSPKNSLNIIKISKSNFFHNYQFLSSLNKNINIAPVLKSNAYGHGSIIMAKLVDPLKPPFICVNNLPEAIELFQANIKTPILIMGAIPFKILEERNYPFSYAVSSIEQFWTLLKYSSPIKIHVFVDTGLNRDGISVNELELFMKKIKENNNVEIEGLMSHFAMANKPNDNWTRQQVNRFELAKRILIKYDIFPKWIHISASCGLLTYNRYTNLGNMARVGKAIYGMYWEDKVEDLKPVLQMESTLVLIKQVSKGEKIGYDFTFTAQKNMRVGLIPCGYYEGLDRRLTNKGYVTINDTPCPIVGKVSMNMTVIDITSINLPFLGQKVVVYSNKQEAVNSLSHCSKICGTIPLEILAHLSTSIYREVIE